MKIQKLTYSNFRNYGQKGEINFDKPGKISIIYGTNGDGKTTLHQLFRWVLYGVVSFNKTTSSTKLYNLKVGSSFMNCSNLYVMGEISFDHEGVNYVAHREWGYYKNSSGVIQRRQEGDEFYVNYQNEDNDWRQVDQPQELIETILPSGLSPYFFFDGETMIADLKLRGTDSAKSLNNALTILFDLYIYQRAMDDIGKNTAGSSTVLGKLENERLKAIKNTGDVDAAKYEREIRSYNKKLESCYEFRSDCSTREKELRERIKEISELIGTNKSKRRLEADRETWKDQIETYQKDIRRIRLEFGKTIENNYSFLLIDAVVKDAEQRMYMKVQAERKNLIAGLRKELLKNLLKKQDVCICGKPIDHNSREHLEEWLSYFPPASYKSTYDRFKNTASKHSGIFDEEMLCNSFLTRIYEKFGKIRQCEKKIEEIDEELKSCGDIDALIDERGQKEQELKRLLEDISQNERDISKYESQRDVRNRLLAKAGKNNDTAKQYAEMISLVQKTYQLIQKEKQDQTEAYSRRLESEIQRLVDTMLTSKRRVELTNDFQLRVVDSFEDESKSEGQFAVVSFAYIGAILKVLQTHERLHGKEYPLVLDGPFSKLDPEQKQNVLDTLPKYANQVIIMSKDPLQEYVDMDNLGDIYTIESNEEKNFAVIKEGYLWK